MIKTDGHYVIGRYLEDGTIELVNEETTPCGEWEQCRADDFNAEWREKRYHVFKVVPVEEN